MVRWAQVALDKPSAIKAVEIVRDRAAAFEGAPGMPGAHHPALITPALKATTGPLREFDFQENYYVDRS